MAAPQTAVSSTQALGVPGQLANFQSAGDADVYSRTSEEASAGIPFGIMVKKGANDGGVLLITATNSVLDGVAVHAQDFARVSELDTDGLQPGTTFGLLREGDIIVTVEDAVTPSAEVHVRATANGGNIQPGAFRGTADAGHTIDVSAFCQWLTSAAPGGLAVLHVEMANAALAVAE